VWLLLRWRAEPFESQGKQAPPLRRQSKECREFKKGISNLKFQISGEEQLQEKRQSDTAENPERGRNFNEATIVALLFAAPGAIFP
jgi:hypothetical protein